MCPGLEATELRLCKGVHRLKDLGFREAGRFECVCFHWFH